jgi:hypothetical protein
MRGFSASKCNTTEKTERNKKKEMMKMEEIRIENKKIASKINTENNGDFNVERMKDNRLANRAVQRIPRGRRNVGRPERRWTDHPQDLQHALAP